MTSTSPKKGADPASLRIRTEMMEHLCQIIRSRNLTQAQAAAWLHISQPRVSNLLRMHLHRFSADSLIGLLASAGVHVTLMLEPPGDTGAGDAVPPATGS